MVLIHNSTVRQVNLVWAVECGHDFIGLVEQSATGWAIAVDVVLFVTSLHVLSMLLVTMFVALSDFAALPSLLSLRVLAECASWVC